MNPTSTKYSGEIKVVSIIEDEEAIKEIFKHLGLLDISNRPPPKTTISPKTLEYKVDNITSQLPENQVDRQWEDRL